MALLEKLEQTYQRLCDLNSASPETRKFLESKGLTNVNQLDERGMGELTDHLLAAAGIMAS